MHPNALDHDVVGVLVKEDHSIAYKIRKFKDIKQQYTTN